MFMLMKFSAIVQFGSAKFAPCLYPPMNVFVATISLLWTEEPIRRVPTPVSITSTRHFFNFHIHVYARGAFALIAFSLPYL